MYIYGTLARLSSPWKSPEQLSWCTRCILRNVTQLLSNNKQPQWSSLSRKTSDYVRSEFRRTAELKNWTEGLRLSLQTEATPPTYFPHVQFNTIASRSQPFSLVLIRVKGKACFPSSNSETLLARTSGRRKKNKRILSLQFFLSITDQDTIGIHYCENYREKQNILGAVIIVQTHWTKRVKTLFYVEKQPVAFAYRFHVRSTPVHR